MESEDHRKLLCQGLQDLWKEQILCDVAVTCINMDKSVYNAHKVVLMSCSKFFYTLFNSNRSDTDTVCLSEGSHEDIFTILQFIYSGELNLTGQNIKGVQHLAQLLQIQEAVRACEAFSHSLEVVSRGNNYNSVNPKPSFETKVSPRIACTNFEVSNASLNARHKDFSPTAKFQNTGLESPGLINEIKSLESKRPVQTNTDQVGHANLQSSVKHENSKSKNGKGNVIRGSGDNTHAATDLTVKQSTSKVFQVCKAVGFSEPSSVSEQTCSKNKGHSSAFDSQTLSETSRPMSEPSLLESVQGTTDFDDEKLPTRLKRKCFIPKKLEDFTLITKPQENSLDESTHTSPKKGRGRPRKTVQAAECQLECVMPQHISEEKVGGGHESTINTKRPCGRPRKIVDEDGKTATSVKTFDKRLTPGRNCKKKKESESTNNCEENSVLNDGSCIKRKRGRPKGSKIKKESLVSNVNDSSTNNESKRFNSSDFTETNEIGLSNTGGEMDSKIESPKKLKSAKSITKGIKKRKCRRCKEEFDTVSSLERHRIACRKSVSFDQPNKYKRKRCGTCQLDFDDYESFQEHRNIHKVERKKKLSRKPYSCDLCEQTFRYENFLACHRFSKHKIPYDDSKFTVLKCQFCDFVTVNRWRHKMHMNQHENLRPYICEVCGKGFNVSSTLATHKKSHFEGKHECPECGKKFTHEHTKVSHVRRVHKKEMPFLCHMCLFKCFGKTELLQHLDKEHNIPLPKGYVRYNCELCEFMTFRKFHFENHMNAHGGEKKFECKVCHKKYVTKMVLRCHMQFHKEPRHKCTWEGCKYAAVQRRRLEQHIRLMHTHQDEKPYPCHICTYRAALRGNLNLHLRNVHHVDVRKRKGMNQKEETTLPNTGEKGDHYDSQLCTFPVTSINSSDIVQMAVASCGDISSSLAPIQDPSMETETLVIYTTESMIPSQLTATQLLEFRGQDSTMVSHSMGALEGAQTVTIMTPEETFLPEQHNSETALNGKDLQRNYQELQGHLMTTSGSETGRQIHFQHNVLSQNESEHTSALPQNIHSELTALNNDLHQHSMSQAIPGSETMAQDIRSVQVHTGDNQEVTTGELTSSLGQEILNTQYTEGFLPDTQNLMVHTMETREGFSNQTAYWTNF